MKNAKQLVARAVAECASVGIKAGNIVSVTVNSRASRWGRCTKRGNSYAIELSVELLRDDVPDSATMDTVVHEVLHTCNGCMNHKALWKHYASIMNRTYGYNVKRVTSAEEKGIERKYTVKLANYVVRCQSCNHTYTYQREGKVVKLIRRYGENSGCRCGVCKSRRLVLVRG